MMSAARRVEIGPGAHFEEISFDVYGAVLFPSLR